MQWAYEVASAMEYISAKKVRRISKGLCAVWCGVLTQDYVSQVYHGDLAARNILLTDDLTAKVGDFGLSKQLDMEEYSVYVKQTQVMFIFWFYSMTD